MILPKIPLTWVDLALKVSSALQNPLLGRLILSPQPHLKLKSALFRVVHSYMLYLVLII